MKSSVQADGRAGHPSVSEPMSLNDLNSRITRCRHCPRLVAWREEVARTRRAQYRDEEYWGRPVPGFGDPAARLLVVGMAPAAHGANRTGRMFTGDRSGEWLFRALHAAGFSNKADSADRADGLRLRDAYVTAMVRCAPPGNKPSNEERDACADYFAQELAQLTRVRVILPLGKFAWDGVLRALAAGGATVRPRPSFGHGAQVVVGAHILIGSYHPSQQNTFTGRLTREMLQEVLDRARQLAAGGDG